MRDRDHRRLNTLSKIRVVCDCSHVLHFPVYDADVKVCSHCGRYVYRNDKVKFENKLLEVLKAKKKNA